MQQFLRQINMQAFSDSIYGIIDQTVTQGYM